MAHKKAGGSSRNGRDSQAKRLGVKAFGGELTHLWCGPPRHGWRPPKVPDTESDTRPNERFVRACFFWSGHVRNWYWKGI